MTVLTQEHPQLRFVRPTAADWLVGVGVVLPMIALVWWYVSGVPAPHATAGPIVLAVVGAVMVLYGVVLYAKQPPSPEGDGG